MLTACIVYVQGSAGNLLARCLTLDTSTVGYVNADTTQKRFELYNNWDSTNWTKSEKGLEIDFVTGAGDFYPHEDSEQKLIYRCHPLQYVAGCENLWNGDIQWKDIIKINLQSDDVETITNFAAKKRTDLDHGRQIAKELKAFDSIIPTQSIDFKTILNQSEFLAQIEKLAGILDVEYYPEYVAQMYELWHKETMVLL